MGRQVIVLAATLALAPVGANAADLVLLWNKAHHPQEDEALAEVVAVFEQETGKEVEVTLLPEAEQPPYIEAALEAGRPPDVALRLMA
jgi:ABC-type glycerol-3-phosphate transport system substrate-binding protein